MVYKYLFSARVWCVVLISIAIRKITVRCEETVSTNPSVVWDDIVDLPDIFSSESINNNINNELNTLTGKESTTQLVLSETTIPTDLQINDIDTINIGADSDIQEIVRNSAENIPQRDAPIEYMDDQSVHLEDYTGDVDFKPNKTNYEVFPEFDFISEEHEAESLKKISVEITSDLTGDRNISVDTSKGLFGTSIRLHDLLQKNGTVTGLGTAVQKPGRHQSSLAFVFDSTGSMWDDLEQLKEGAEKIMNAMKDRDDKPIYNYVLVPFHDPKVGPVTVTNDQELLRNKLNEIDVYGGGDCPEMSLGGIRKALEVSLPGSYMYVLTDATSADHYLVTEILDQVQRKKTQIVFVLTGDCNNRTSPQYTVYERIAEASSGQVFHLNKSDVNQVLDFVRETLDSRRVGILAVDNIKPTSDISEKHNVDVDESLTEFMVSVSGDTPTIQITNPGGELVENPPQVTHVLSLDKIKVVNVIQPEVGRWEVTVSSPSEHTVRLTGLSDLKFEHGFAVKPANSLDETNHRPLHGSKNYLLIRPSNVSVLENITSVEMVGIDGQPLRSLRMKPLPGGNGLYTSEAVLPPGHFFHLTINGFDRNGNPLTRTTTTAIKPQFPDKPYVRTESVVAGPIHKPLNLSCHVESLISVSVQWYKNGKPVSDVFQKDQSGVFFWTDPFPTTHSAGEYICLAKNSVGSSDAKVEVIITEPPVLKKGTRSKVVVAPGSSMEASCYTTAGFPAPVTYWMKDDRELRTGGNIFLTYNNSLTIRNISNEDRGVYHCIATNSAGVDFYKLDVQVQSLPSFPDDRQPAHHTGMVGDTLVLKCNALGEPKPLITWTKDDNPVAFNNIVTRDEDNSLVLSKLAKKHSGVYICTAFNTAGSSNRTMSVQVLVPPKIVPVGDDIMNAVEGEMVTLRCPVAGDPVPDVNWFMNTLPMQMNNKLLDHENTLRFVANVSDSGVYECIAFNEAGNSSREWMVLVFMQPSIYPPDDEVVHVLPSDKVELSCNAVGFPRPNIQWRKGNQPILNNTEVGINDGGTLVVFNAKQNTSGVYSCDAENQAGITQKLFYLVINIPPKIINVTDFVDISLLQGEDFSIACKAEGNPVPFIAWTKDSRPIRQGGVFIDSENTLTITGASHENTGIYRCEASNSIGSDGKEYNLTVLVPPQMVLSNSTVYIRVIEGECLQLECPHIKSFPPPSITWMKNGVNVEDYIHQIDIREAVFEPITKTKNPRFFQIDPVHRTDAGLYACIASNLAGDAQAEMFVTVLHEPIIKGKRDVPVQIVKRVGQDVLLLCEVDGEPLPKVQWMRGSQVINISHVLFLENLQLHHAGYYVCRAQNSVGSNENRYYLEITEPPNLKGPSHEVIEVQTGGSVMLSCPVSGHPEPQIKWELPDSVNSTEMNVGEKTLRILEVTLEHDGPYICTATNDEGSITKTIQLNILAPPSIETSPTNRTIRVREQQQFEMVCDVRSVPKSRLLWYHNGVRLTELDYQQSFTARTKSISGDLVRFTLAIRGTNAEHAGVYTCWATNKVGEANEAFNVTVLLPPTLSTGQHPKNVESLEGLPVTLQCPVVGTPEPEIEWTLNNATIDETDPNVRNASTFLSIESMNAKYSGTYVCIGKNEVGEISVPYHVVTLVAPQIGNDPTANTIRVVKGDSLTLRCDVHGYPQPDILWLKGSNPIEYAVVSENNSVVKIPNVTVNHRGTYSCLAISKAGAAEYFFNVDIQEAPYSTNNEPPETSLSVERNRGLVLHCNVAGSPEPVISWSKNGVRLTNDYNWPQLQISQDGHHLQIANTKLSDEGPYICTSENPAGVLQRQFNVSVIVSGTWTDWSTWSPCNATCGPGFRVRNRVCDFGEDLDDRKPIDCEGSASETATCLNDPCSIDGGWSDWTNWTTCSEPCGPGIRTRIRYCNNPQPSFGGTECEGSHMEKEQCSIRPCKEDGNWSGWSEWSGCSQTCGKGYRTRQRTCTNPEPAHGGEYCKGKPIDQSWCNVHPCPQNGGWTDWGPWGPCSSTCGLGARSKTRSCTNPEPKFGGSYCSGENLMIDECILRICRRGPTMAKLHVKGLLNNEEIKGNIISANISSEGVANIISITGEDLLKNQKGWFPYQTFLVSPMSWTMEDDEDNGGFEQKSKIAFSTGQELVVKQASNGMDKDGILQVEIEVRGQVPIVQDEANIIIDPFSEKFIQTGNGRFYSTSKNNLKVDGRDVSYTWKNAIRYNNSRRSDRSLVETVSTHNIQTKYDPRKREIRYTVSNVLNNNTATEDCPAGFRRNADQNFCTDIDECSVGHWQVCHSTQSCENTFGSYNCHCHSGYKSLGNGFRCLDVNECLLDIHYCSHSCENLPGGYVCKCPDGMILASDAHTCKKVLQRTPKYDDNNLHPMINSRKYVDNHRDYFNDLSQEMTMHNLRPKKHYKECPMGYTASNSSCEDVNECALAPDLCDSNQSCLNIKGSYLCIATPCPEQFERRPRSSSCVQLCGANHGLSCSDGALVAQSVSYTTLSVRQFKVKPYEPLMLLQMYSVDGKPLINTSYNLQDSTPEDTFEVHLEDNIGVLTTYRLPLTDRVHRITVIGNAYDVKKSSLLYTTKFIIYFYISN